MKYSIVGVLIVLATHLQGESLQGESARLDFDLGRGTYDLTVGGTPAIRNAFATVEGWSSADPGYQRKITDKSGIRLGVECSRPDAPALLMEFTMHPGYVEIRAGIKNTTAEPIRLKKFEPLTGGVVFPGGEWSDVRTLDAPSGANLPRVTGSAVRGSANNLLLTFTQAGVRRSLVLGALKTADFTKWAGTRSATIDPERLGMRQVGYLDCGNPGAGASIFRVVRGKPFTWGGTDGPSGSVLFDEQAVELEVAPVDPRKRHVLGFSWWDKDANGRVQSVWAGDKPLVEKRVVPTVPVREIRAIPAECCRDGRLKLAFANAARVPNAVVSEVWLWEMDAGASIPADLTERKVTAAVEGYDPVGRLVEPGETYLPADSFHVDAGTVNPFEALEKYGRALREATGARPNPYDFPTVCAWYAGVWKTPGAQNHPENSSHKLNTTAGLVEEAEKMRASGFLAYSRTAGRLVPDSYTPQNPQGWWDDEHWRQHGYFTPPYETSAKFGEGMHRHGVLAFLYIQPVIQPPQFGQRISQDFRETHRDWLLNKDVARGGLDYSQPAVQDYVRSRFAALRGHVDGLMVDYCDDLWMMTMRGHDAEARLAKTTWEAIPADAERIEFADPHMTATAFYRMFFRCVKDGLGPHSWLHERNLSQPDNDLLLGIADSQRTGHDTDKISPDLVSCSGLRWYKNRVVLAYDMDSKELTSAWKTGGWTGSDQDGRRMLLTMAYVAAGRLLLANSFRDLSKETLHDLSRTFPYPNTPKSARPVDAFVRDGWPRVYDHAVTPDWHQVALFNNTLPTREETIAVALSGDTANGALGLDPGAEYYIHDFWNNRFIGKLRGADTLQQTLRSGEARMLALHRVEKNPQFIATNRHLMQGELDMLERPRWDAAAKVLRGTSRVIGGEEYQVLIACNGRVPGAASADGATATIRPLAGVEGLVVLALGSQQGADLRWEIRFP